MQHELFANESVSQSELQFFTLLELRIERGRIILETSTATFLRLVHRDIGGLDKSLGRVA